MPAPPEGPWGWADRLVLLRGAARGLKAKLHALASRGKEGGGGPPACPASLYRRLGAFAPGLPAQHLQELQNLEADALAMLQENPEHHWRDARPWAQLAEDVVAFRGHAVRLLEDMCKSKHSDWQAHACGVQNFMGLVDDLFSVCVLAAVAKVHAAAELYLLVCHIWMGCPESVDPVAHAKVLKGLMRMVNEPVKYLRLDLDFAGPACKSLTEAYATLPRRLVSGDAELFSVTQATQWNWEHACRVNNYQDWVRACALLYPEQSRTGLMGLLIQELMETNVVTTVFKDVGVWLHGEVMMNSADRQLRTKVEHCVQHAVEQGIASHVEARFNLIKAIQGLKNLFETKGAGAFLELPKASTCLAVAHNEIRWYFSHAGRKLPAAIYDRLPTGGAEPLEGLTSVHLMPLIGEACQLIATLRRKKGDLARAVARHLRGEAAGLLPAVNRMSKLDVDAPMLKALRTLLDAFLQPESDVAGGGVHSFGGMRMSWLRMCTAPGSRSALRHLDGLGNLPGKTTLSNRLHSMVFLTQYIDKLDSALVEFCDLSFIYFHRDVFQKMLADTCDLGNGENRSLRYLGSFLSVFSSFLDNNHAFCKLTQFETAADQSADRLILAISGSIDHTFRKLLAAGLKGFDNQVNATKALRRMDKGSGWSLVKSKVKGMGTGNKSIFGLTSMMTPIPGYESQPQNAHLLKETTGLLETLKDLCSSLSGMGIIPVSPSKAVHPSGCLIRALKETVRISLDAHTKRGVYLERPRNVEGDLSRIKRMLGQLQPYCGMSLHNLLREVFHDAEGSPGVLRYVAQQYAQFYTQVIAADIHRLGVVYAPSLFAFISAQGPPALQASTYGDVDELRAFVRAFGRVGFDVFEGRLEAEVADALTKVYECLQLNSGLLGDLLHICKTASEVDTTVKALAKLRDLEHYSIVLGRCVRLHQMLVEAAAAEQDADRAYEGTLAAADGTGGRSHAFQSTVLARAKAKHAAYENPLWHQVHLLYACLMLSDLWDSTVYDVHNGAFAHDPLSWAYGMKGLCVLNCESKAAAEAGGSAKPAALHRHARAVFKEFLQCATSMVFKSEQVADAKIIFLDALVDGFWVDRGMVEAYVPSGLVMSAHGALRVPAASSSRGG